MPSFIRGSGAILRQDSSLSEVVEIFDRHRSLRLKHFMRSGEAGHYGRRGIGLSTNRISMDDPVARALLDYLKGDHAKAIIRSYGYDI